MKMLFLLLNLLVCLNIQIFGLDSKKIIGYYPSWALYRNPPCKPCDLPGHLLTHINYAFAKVDTLGNIHLVDPWADVEYRSDWNTQKPYWGHFHQLQELKKKYPHLKILISIGGWTLSDSFSSLASSSIARTQFVNNCIHFCKQYGFDGIDIDWEYPGFGEHQGRPEDKENFTLLLQELHTKAKEQSPKLLVTIAAPAGPAHLQNIEIEKFHPFVDWVNLMTYDFHGPWGGANDQVTNHHAPLYPSAYGPDTFNVDSAVKEFLKRGMPAEKIIVGIPLYGRSYSGVISENGLFSPYSGVGRGTTAEKGIVFFSEIPFLLQKGYFQFWDERAHSSYLYSPGEKEFISFDSLEVIEDKCTYVKSHGLGGIMVWELGQDIFPDWKAFTLIGKTLGFNLPKALPEKQK